MNLINSILNSCLDFINNYPVASSIFGLGFVTPFPTLPRQFDSKVLPSFNSWEKMLEWMRGTIPNIARWTYENAKSIPDSEFEVKASIFGTLKGEGHIIVELAFFYKKSGGWKKNLAGLGLVPLAEFPATIREKFKRGEEVDITEDLEPELGFKL